jgi:DNA-binding transcriptional regulator PaaX
MPKYEIVKKRSFIKQIEENKSKAIILNLIKLLLGIWDCDNLKKENDKYKRLLKEWEPILNRKQNEIKH